MAGATLRWAVALGAMGAGLLFGTPLRAEESSSIEDVVKVLKRKGMVDDTEERTVVAKYATETNTPLPKWIANTQFNGDFLLRYETFLFDQDALGVTGLDRTRFQYRARFGLTNQISPRVKIGFRLASGAGDRRSTNSSFGESAGDQFSPDGIFFDRAFVEVKLQESPSMKTQFTAGKFSNPFMSRVGPDFLLFDGDLNLEGASLTSTYRPSETSQIYATAGGFIIDEIAVGKDPKLVAGQLGFDTSIGPKLRVGLRGTALQFRSLEATFQGLGRAFGNLPGAFPNGRSSIGETYAYALYNWSETFPVLVFGQVIKNFSAQSGLVRGVNVGDDDNGYGFGLVVGNPAKLLQLTLTYYKQEANAIPAQFPDGATFDTMANREGILAIAARRINPITDFRLSYSDIQEIESTGGAMGPFGMNLTNSDRKRIVADIVFSF